MRVLVTGGAGFLGSHLCDALLARGDEVVAVDNFSTGRPENVEHLADNRSFTLVEADVTGSVPDLGVFDAVAHLASPASPPEYLRMPLETLAVGSRGSEYALGQQLRGRGRVLLASTSEIYGEPQVHPQPETYWGNVNSIGPRSVYDEAKRYAEALFFAHRRARNTNTGVVRIFNTYGPRLRPQDGRVVSNFVDQALRDEPLTVYGDGQQTRSFCFVSDLIRGLIAMLDADDPGPINLGNDTETSVGALAQLVIELTGAQSDVTFHPRPTDDPTVRRPQLHRAREILSWAPTVDLREGLLATIAWQVEQHLLTGGPGYIRIPDPVRRPRSGHALKEQ